MSLNNPKPNKPIVTLIMIIVISTIGGLFLYFVSGTYRDKMAAVIVMPILIAYAFYAYFHEKKDDKKAKVMESDIIDGTYFRTSEWQEKYIEYRINNTFERPAGASMKADLFRRYRRKQTFFFMILIGILFCLSAVSMFYIFQWWELVGVIVFAVLMFSCISDFTGRPVREFLKRDIDYPALEHSYMNGRMLTFKNNGIIFGLTHIHIYTRNNVWAIDYRIAEDITRKIVRVKEYDDGIYSGNNFKHYAVIHVRVYGSSDMKEIELNEYQVQMVIDEFSKIKFTGKDKHETRYNEIYD